MGNLHQALILSQKATTILTSERIASVSENVALSNSLKPTNQFRNTIFILLGIVSISAILLYIHNKKKKKPIPKI